MRERRNMVPAIPNSLQELIPILNNIEIARGVYQTHFIADDGSIELVFGNDFMKEVIRGATELYIDGTFKVSTTLQS